MGGNWENNTLDAKTFSCAFCSVSLQVSQPGGVLLEKLVWGVRPTSLNPYTIYDQNLRFWISFLWPNKKFDNLFKTVAADTVALNISNEGFLLTVLLTMMKSSFL